MMNIVPGNKNKFSPIAIVLGLLTFSYYLYITQILVRSMTKLEWGLILTFIVAGIYFTFKLPNQKDKL